jgi:putative transposase
VLLETLTSLSWAYQLHYYLCFHTHRRRQVFATQELIDRLNAALEEICQRHDYHLLQAKVYPDHLRCLLSLRPAQTVSSVIQTIKANATRACQVPLWARGYLARSVGRVRLANVKQYIEEQAEHHGYSIRMRPPIFRYRAKQPVKLTAAHASFELNHHLVLATRYRAGVFDSTLGKALGQYWLRVSAKRGFAIDRLSVLPEHIHLLVEQCPR